MSLKTQQLQLLLNNLAGISLDDFKKEALPLVRSGADLRVCGSSAPYRTVLHHLVLTNKDGANDEAITELLKLQSVNVDAKDVFGNSALRSLINQAQSNQCSAEDFKKTAMLLARHGADLSVSGSAAPYRTVLHHLVLTNKDGAHDEAITELLKLQSVNVDAKDVFGNSALRSLINQAQSNQCSAEDFKKTAMLLARHGADLSVSGSAAPYRTVLHHLVLTNKDGAHDEAITELLKLQSVNVDAKDVYGNSALRSLINQAQSNQCSAEDFKKTAMLLARHGADLSVSGSAAPYRTVLHHLVLTNKDGAHDEAITELLKLQSVNVEAKDAYGNSALRSLINQAQSNQCSAEDFKKTAMLLARHGADLSVSGSAAPYRTVLHHLVLTNKDGAHDEAITELLKLQSVNVDAKDAYGNSALRSLINQAQSNQCSAKDFKKTAMLLARHGADLSVSGSAAPYRTVLHHLVLTNKNGAHDKAITELLKLKPVNVDAKDAYGNSVLRSLINQAQSNQCSAEDFKKTAMLLARHGADLSVYG